MPTNLIIVEGLPGSGKSTTAAGLARELTKRGRRILCVDEGAAEHPADYAEYDFPDFETERTEIYEKWRSFVEDADRDTIYVFNCIFLQNPMCETMMRFGMEAEDTEEYIAGTAEIIRPIDPLILYIDTPDVRAVVGRVMEERGKDWLNFVIDYHVSQGYGKQNGLSGYDGYIRCLEERRKRELRILQALDIDSRILRADMTADELAALADNLEGQLGMGQERLPFSKKYYVRRLDKNDVDMIYEMSSENHIFYQ